MVDLKQERKKSNKTVNVMLIGAFLLIVLLPLIFNAGAEFAGADGLAEAQIVLTAPEYEPWFQSLWEPPSGEIESLLFAAQASAGTGFIAYFFGLMKGRQQSARD